MLSYYPYNPNIHNFGNIGFKGRIHSELAPLFTKLIDIKAYNGRNIRQEIIEDLQPKKNKILDICCGIGISTAKNAYGIDTSQQMLQKARREFKNKNFLRANAENIKMKNLQDKFNINFDKFDYVTCMFAFHEMPPEAHETIIENSINLAKKEIIILDISSDYKISRLMRAGEPYLLKYLKTIDNTMNRYSFSKTNYIPKHATLWKYTV